MFCQEPSSILISGYVNTLYEALEDEGWERIDFDMVCYAAGRVKKSKLKGKGSGQQVSRVESVWRNPRAINKLKNNTILDY